MMPHRPAMAYRPRPLWPTSPPNRVEMTMNSRLMGCFEKPHCLLTHRAKVSQKFYRIVSLKMKLLKKPSVAWFALLQAICQVPNHA